MTRGEFVAMVAAKASLTDEDGHFEQDFMRTWCNEGVVETLLETHIFISIGDMVLIAGTAEYRLDANVLAIDDGRGSTPAGIGHYELISLSEMISRQSVGSVEASFRKLLAIEGDLLVVHPNPSADEVLRFFYVPKPTPMTEDSHDPSDITYGGIATQHHKAIQYYMLWQAAEYDEKRLPYTSKDYYDMFQGECGKIRERRSRLRGRSMMPGRVGYPNSQRLAKRNDVYPR